MTHNILMVTAEAYPLAKTGGLADAVGGLVRALRAEGVPVTIIMPGWPSAISALSDTKVLLQLHEQPGGTLTLVAGNCKLLDTQVILVCSDHLFNRPGMYVDADGDEYADNAVRFAALSKAAAHVAGGIQGMENPAVVHVHDWHAALTPVYMHQQGVVGVSTMLTVHNVAFQGLYPLEVAASLGIGNEYYTNKGVEFWGQINFLKAGIQFSDLVTVVSCNYAKEIFTPRYGCGLEGVLLARGADVIAIPNGIDTAIWNPAHDPLLGRYTFNVNTLENKAVCKRQVQLDYGLKPWGESFLLAMCNRLTAQKMSDVAAEALPLALEKHPTLQVCILGKGEKKAEESLAALAVRFPERSGVHLGYSEIQAHRLHAGADALLHGSRFEPFGLAPLYAMRYGTIPIASRVGGMVDTIRDFGRDFPSADYHNATGILFDGDTTADMLSAIDRAIALRQLPTIWRRMQRNAMTQTIDWRQAAMAYISAYRSLSQSESVPDKRRRNYANPLSGISVG